MSQRFIGRLPIVVGGLLALGIAYQCGGEDSDYFLGAFFTFFGLISGGISLYLQRVRNLSNTFILIPVWVWSTASLALGLVLLYQGHQWHQEGLRRTQVSPEKRAEYDRTMSQADVVFLGTVSRVTVARNRYTYEVRIENVVKGQMNDRRNVSVTGYFFGILKADYRTAFFYDKDVPGFEGKRARFYCRTVSPDTPLELLIAILD